MAQSWNNILNYIKRNLGAKLNLLELSDEEILDGLKEDVLPYFSQFVPNKKALIISNANLSSDITQTRNQYTYTLPIPEDDYITDISEVYFTNYIGSDPFYGTKYSSMSLAGSMATYGYGTVGVAGGALIDAAVTNIFLDILNYFSVKQTWEFFPPDKIAFEMGIKNDAIVIYLTEHRNPTTIMPDMYNICFKSLCLGNVMKWIVALRSKYENLSTPVGEINMNWQKLEQDSERIIEKAEDKLERVPFDRLLEII